MKTKEQMVGEANQTKKVWDEDQDFRKLIGSDKEVTSHLSHSELEDVFDHSFYVRFVDETFERIGLN